MENKGLVQLIVCFYTTLFSWVSMGSMQAWVSLIASIVAIISGAFAGMYYLESWKNARVERIKKKRK